MANAKATAMINMTNKQSPDRQTETHKEEMAGKKSGNGVNKKLLDMQIRKYS